MNITTVLLASRDEALTETVAKLARSIPGCDFAAFCDMDQIEASLAKSQPALVICHVTEATVEQQLQMLQVWRGQRVPVATLMICEQLPPEIWEKLLACGAADCLSRPLDLRRLAFLIDSFTLIARYGPARRGEPTEELAPGSAERPFEFRSSEMIDLVQRVRKVATQDVSVLITGETGVGKTRLARLIHDLSPRCDEIFLTVNCAALSENLLESELFGHSKGAFTGADGERIGKFAAAGNGTLLLDEIDSLPLPAQPKLLRVVDERVFEPVGSNQSKKLQARLLIATNRNLAEEVAAGRFRSDLYYRLKVVEFELPPLRLRRKIIPIIAEAQVWEGAVRNRRPHLRLSPEALQALTLYDWPGNIRELRNVIEGALAFADEEIRLEHLPEAIQRVAAAPQPRLQAVPAIPPERRPPGAEAPHVRPTAPSEGAAPIAADLSTLAQARASGEIAQLRYVLEQVNNNRSLAARVLGISRAALYKKLRKYGLLDSTG